MTNLCYRTSLFLSYHHSEKHTLLQGLYTGHNIPLFSHHQKEEKRGLLLRSEALQKSSASLPLSPSSRGSPAAAAPTPYATVGTTYLGMYRTLFLSRQQRHGFALFLDSPVFLLSVSPLSFFWCSMNLNLLHLSFKTGAFGIGAAHFVHKQRPMKYKKTNI